MGLRSGSKRFGGKTGKNMANTLDADSRENQLPKIKHGNFALGTSVSSQNFDLNYASGNINGIVKQPMQDSVVGSGLTRKIPTTTKAAGGMAFQSTISGTGQGSSPSLSAMGMQPGRNMRQMESNMNVSNFQPIGASLVSSGKIQRIKSASNVGKAFSLARSVSMPF